MSENMNKKLSSLLFLQRENQIKHPAYEKELSFYSLVKDGNVKALREAENEFTFIDKAENGILSENPKRNLLYHLIVTIAMITRFCIEGGMDSETAYTLSDLYIQKADKASSYEELKEIHKEVSFDFANKMNSLRKDVIFSKHIIQCLDYIFEHLNESISINQIANYIHINETYLSKLFKKETGITIGEYIQSKKIEVAENMLKYSDYSCVDIANFLAFSSHSYFIQVFKKHSSLTPNSYRKINYRKNWNIPSQFKNTKDQN